MKKRSLAKYANQFEMYQIKKEEEEKKQEQKPDPEPQEKQEAIQEESKPEEKEKDHQPEPEKVDDQADDLDYLAEFKKKQPAKIKETFDIDPELHRELKAISKRYGYGFKTKFINSAIKRELERIKKLEKKK